MSKGSPEGLPEEEQPTEEQLVEGQSEAGPKSDTKEQLEEKQLKEKEEEGGGEEGPKAEEEKTAQELISEIDAEMNRRLQELESLQEQIKDEIKIDVADSFRDPADQEDNKRPYVVGEHILSGYAPEDRALIMSLSKAFKQKRTEIEADAEKKRKQVWHDRASQLGKKMETI